jgi:ferric-dicitrate binding protein FerR (iron transport regulator)
MKRMAMMVLALCLVGIPSGSKAAEKKAASTDAVFASVSGTVTVKTQKGTAKTVKQGDHARQGETVTVAKGGSAALKLFDGSTIELKSNSRIVLTTLKKSSKQDNKLRFKLAFGELVAKVKKLLTPKSSFEIEAGGVVCGVRGTAYTISYDPETGVMTIKVTEGSVLVVDKNGNKYLVKAGEEMEFVNGKPKKDEPKEETTSSGEGSNEDTVTLALEDLNSQFESGLGTNGDKNFSDANGSGPVKVNVQVRPGQPSPLQ